MELRERKYIGNTGSLPGFEDGLNFAGRQSAQMQLNVGLTDNAKNAISNLNNTVKSTGGLSGALANNAGTIMSGVTGAIGMVGQIGAASSYGKTANDLLQQAGQSSSNIGGVGYTVQNGVDADAESKEVSAQNKANTLGLMGTGASLGATVGSIGGPIGTVIGGAVGAVGGLVGGLLGGASKRRKMLRAMRLAEMKRINQNDFSRSGALTTSMQNDLAQTEGDQSQQTLYAADGKESYSAQGPASGYNARVSNGEIIANKFTGDMFRVPGTPNNKDSKLAFIHPSDTIISNKYGLSDYVALTGDLEGGEAMQGTIMKALGKRGYKNGKLPGFKWGLPEWTNMAVNGLGAISSLVDANNIENEPISRPNIYSGNHLQGTALNTLQNLRANAYPILPQIYDQMGKGMYAINNAGGLSGGQRTLSRLAAMQNVYDSTAKMLLDAQDRNAKYQMAYADAAANLGNEEARRMMQANQFNYEAYNQAHGAKRAMTSQRKADAMNYLNNWAKGLNDMHMWRKMMNLYEEDVNSRKQKNISSVSAPKVKIDPNNIFGNTNFSGFVPQTSIPEFTAETPQDKIRRTSPKIPKSWVSNKDYMKVKGVNKVPTSYVPNILNYLNSINYGIRS